MSTEPMDEQRLAELGARYPDPYEQIKSARDEAMGQVERLRAENAALRNELLAESVKTPEIRELEIGDAVCAVVCGKLRAILDTGEHTGVFGGDELEALAQAILQQRAVVEAAKRVKTTNDAGGWDPSRVDEFSDREYAIDALIRSLDALAPRVEPQPEDAL